MGPVTRSVTRDHFVFTTGFEKITHTLDPIQKTFCTTPLYTPYWRYVLYQRYVGTYAPPTLVCTWNDYTNKHVIYNDSIPTNFQNTPANIAQSTLTIRIKSKPHRKLLTVHVYYTTNNILVQGRACGDWVSQEFKNLCTIVHTLAATSTSPLPETDDVVCPASTQPASAIEYQAPVLDTPTTRPSPSLPETGDVVCPASTQPASTINYQAPVLDTHTTRQAGKQAPSPPAALMEVVPEYHDSQPPSPISHLQLPPVQLATDDCSRPSSLTSNHAHPPPPNSLNEEVSPATTPVSTEISDEQPSVTATTITPTPSVTVTTVSPSPSVTVTTEEITADDSDIVQSDDSRATADDTDSDTTVITNDTDSDTTVIANDTDSDTTVIANDTDSDTTVIANDTDSDITVIANDTDSDTTVIANDTDSDTTVIANDTDSDTTVIANDNSSSHTTSMCVHSDCVHSDCVPMTEFLITVQSLQAEISALRSSLQEARQTFKIELDAQSTKLNQVVISNTSPIMTKNTAHRSQPKLRNKSIHTCPITSTNQVHNKSAGPSQLQNPPPSDHPSCSNQGQNKSTSPSQLQNPPTFHPNSTPQSESAVSKSPLPESPLLHASVARETTTILFGDFTVERVDLSRSTPPSGTPQKVCVRDLTVAGLTEWLKRQTSNNNVMQATFHVGVNDCCNTSSATETSVSKQQWGSLISQCRRVFPRAQLQASSIIPACGRSPLNFIIGPSNDHLQEACRVSGVKFINHHYTFTAQSGAPKKALYSSATLPSKRGIELVARSLYPPKRSPLLPTPSQVQNIYIPKHPPKKFSPRPHQTTSSTVTSSHTNGPYRSLHQPPLSRTEFPDLASHHRPVSSLFQSSNYIPSPTHPSKVSSLHPQDDSSPFKPGYAFNNRDGNSRHGNGALTEKRPRDHSNSTVTVPAVHNMGTQHAERIIPWPYGGMCKPLPPRPRAQRPSAPPPPPFPLFPPPPPFPLFAGNAIPPTWYGWPFIPPPLQPTHLPSVQ